MPTPNPTQLDLMRQSAHVHHWVSKGNPKPLKCFRCQRTMPETAFSALSSNISDRRVQGRAGGPMGWVQYLHPWCNMCKRQARGEHVKHPHYSPKIDRYWQKRISGIKGGAKGREILVLIDKDDLLGQCLRQGNRCAITRQPMTFDMNGQNQGINKYTQASVDRIDSNSNYAINNIQIVCNIVNIMKHDLPERDFLRWCALVLDGRRKAEEEILAFADATS